MKAMLDSDTRTFLMNGRPEVVAKEDLHECCISSVVMGELEFAHLNSNRKVENRAKLELLLGNLTVVEVGEAEAKAYADVRLSVKKQRVGSNDLWIAAHARVFACTRTCYHDLAQRLKPNEAGLWP